MAQSNFSGKPKSAAGHTRKASTTNDPPPPEPVPSALLDHPDYQVLCELGRGGMGVVYLAQHRLTGRKEVLKVVSSQLLSRRGVRERFLREIRAAAQLNHPNIVTAFSASHIGESLVLSMQYVEGHDLAELVEKNGPLPVAHACNFVYQAALGLQHAHERGLVHRDIKPSNLMLAREGSKPVVKILDFGLAKVTSEAGVDGGLTQEGQMLGTPHYVAPEQTVDAQKADIRADIYSLGCTLYSLLAGKPPFDAPSLYGLLQAHHSMDAEPLNFLRPGEVSAELAAVVARMLAKEPESRFQTPVQVAEALKPFFKTRVAADARPTDRDNPSSFTLIEAGPPGQRAELVRSRNSHETGRQTLIESNPVERPILISSPVEAGRAHPRWLWPAIAGGVGVTGIVLGFMINNRSGAPEVEARRSSQLAEVSSRRVARAADAGRAAPALEPAPTVRPAQPVAKAAALTDPTTPAKPAAASRNRLDIPPSPPTVGGDGPMTPGPAPAGTTTPPPGQTQTYAMAARPSPSKSRGLIVPAPTYSPGGSLVNRTEPRKQAYAEYAAFVRKLEQETEKIPYNQTGVRSRRYWTPLNNFANQLAAKYGIPQGALIQLIKEGFTQRWPTEETEDWDMVAKLFRRLQTEYKLAARRAEARAGMSMIDNMASMALQQATAAGTMQNNANAAAGRRALGGR
jgi:serine/threonine protein kinase